MRYISSFVGWSQRRRICLPRFSRSEIHGASPTLHHSRETKVSLRDSRSESWQSKCDVVATTPNTFLPARAVTRPLVPRAPSAKGEACPEGHEGEKKERVRRSSILHFLFSIFHLRFSYFLAFGWVRIAHEK